MTNHDACIALNMISGIGYAKYKALCGEFGSPAAALAQPEARLLRVPGIGPQLADRVSNWQRDVDLDGEIERANRAGVRIFTLYDEAYPEILRELADPPLALYVRGELPQFGTGNALAVVGSRRMSRYGEEMAARLTADAVGLGMVIVSGLAFGVDTVAHTVTVERGGITVAVLGGGLARLHPQENLPLARRIIETGGAVISEFPMNFPVSRQSFPRRNRIVARLADAVLVVEAGLDSGAMITANLAADSCGCVLAVPGRVDNPQARGCHQLIKNGATLVETIDDITGAMNFGQLPFGNNFGEPEAEYHPNSCMDLPPEQRAVLTLLQENESASFDELQSSAQLEPTRLNAVLLRLEMLMLVRREGTRYSLKKS